MNTWRMKGKLDHLKLSGDTVGRQDGLPASKDWVNTDSAHRLVSQVITNLAR
jgi:hypothetical protein